MTFEEFQELRKVKEAPNMITLGHLKDVSDRTLVYGYTCKGDTFHLYLEGGYFNRFVYNSQGLLSHEAYKRIEPWYAVPNKRVYPERCDYDFCKVLSSCRVDVPYTVFTKGVYERQYYGETYDF